MVYKFSVATNDAGSLGKDALNLVEPITLDSSVGDVGAFGSALKFLNTGKMALMQAGDSVSLLARLLVRDYVAPANNASNSQFGYATGDVDVPQGGLALGYMNLAVAGGNPVRGQPVYIALNTGVSVYPTGTFAATALDVTFVAVPNLLWATSLIGQNGVALAFFFPAVPGGGGGTITAGAGITIT